jgi:glycine oxidase
MSPPPDVLILGGGVIGLTAAYCLAGEGASVAVVDRAALGQEASWAGAGIIPPGNPEKAASPYERLRAISSRLFPGLSHDLREATGIDNGFAVSGGVAWLDDDAATAVQAWQDEGIRFEVQSGATLAGVEPTLAPGLDSGYFLPDMAQVRNPRHLKALLAWCRDRVTLMADRPIEGFARQGQRIGAAVTRGGSLAAGQFLIAAGAWSDRLLEPLGVRLGIGPVRGQIALLDAGSASPRRILLRGKRYLVPRGDGKVLVGSTEEDAGFDKHTTAEAITDLLAFARALVPGLTSARVERCWAGLRPGSPDGMPFLGRVPGFDNLWVAAGHFRSGIQLSPGTGLLMKELILGQAPTVPTEAFRLDRPPAPPFQAAFRS